MYNHDTQKFARMFILYRDCTHGQGETCKGDAVNFGGWDEFSKKNGVFEFPKGQFQLRVG